MKFLILIVSLYNCFSLSFDGGSSLAGLNGLCIESFQKEVALINAIHDNNPKALENLLTSFNYSVDTRFCLYFENKHSLLDYAIICKAKKSFDALIAMGASVNSVDIHKRTSLHKAAKTGNVYFINALLKAGAEKEARDKKNFTPLHLSIIHNKYKSVISLMHHRAHLGNYENLSPLQLAISVAAEKTFEVLMPYENDVTKKNSKGYSSIDTARYMYAYFRNIGLDNKAKKCRYMLARLENKSALSCRTLTEYMIRHNQPGALKAYLYSLHPKELDSSLQQDDDSSCMDILLDKSFLAPVWYQLWCSWMTSSAWYSFKKIDWFFLAQTLCLSKERIIKKLNIFEQQIKSHKKQLLLFELNMADSLVCTALKFLRLCLLGAEELSIQNSITFLNNHVRILNRDAMVLESLKNRCIAIGRQQKFGNMLVALAKKKSWCDCAVVTE